LASWQSERAGGIGAAVRLHPAILLPDRARLYARCDLRFARMVEQGAVEEVATLLSRNLDPDLPVMRAIGVREITDLLRGTLSLDDARRLGAQATRNYAKRQYTWFRRQPPEQWPRAENETFNLDDVFDI
jgi:tRNA dimethylallyltransferase